MKYIFIAYLAFGSSFWPSWQMLEPKVFDNSETCRRYSDELADSLSFHKKQGQNGVVDWDMTCKPFFDTDKAYEEFLESINGPQVESKIEDECVEFFDVCG